MVVGEASSVIYSSTVGSRYFEHDLRQFSRYLEQIFLVVLRGMSCYALSQTRLLRFPRYFKPNVNRPRYNNCRAITRRI